MKGINTMINYKSEKGGVTIYVLSAMVILIIALISIYVSLNNKQMALIRRSRTNKVTFMKKI